MRVFQHPNMINFKCPICGTSEDKEVVLIPIEETRDGFICEARQYHLSCIELSEMDAGTTDEKILYHKFEVK